MYVFTIKISKMVKEKFLKLLLLNSNTTIKLYQVSIYF